MTSDLKPTKSPARGKGQGTQPVMTQRSLLSFFGTSTPICATNDNGADMAPTSPQDMLNEASLSGSTTSDSILRTPVKSSNKKDDKQVNIFSLESPSPLFSTDEAVLRSSSKRKTIDLEEDENEQMSPLTRDESRSVKKFAAAVKNLSLNSPVRKLRPEDFKDDNNNEDNVVTGQASGTRRSSRGIRRIHYAISDEEGEDDGHVGTAKKTEALRKNRVNYDDEDSEYEAPAALPEDDFNMDIDEADLDDSLLEDDDDAPPSPTRHKQPILKNNPQQSVSAKPVATASIFNKPASSPSKSTSSPARPTLLLKDDKKKERAAKFEEANTGRYRWLLDIRDAEKNPIGSPNYDPRTLYVPDDAWKKFTEFERQFWEIKSKHFDSIVFFKKGKFYELYENDADIGHQQFDLKLTDRTNMRMVGVPESSFEYWAAQFIAKGYKVARVDQMETALGKAMRERDGAISKASAQKVIHRELHSILTAGTLTDSGLLTNEMATYCMAIKELTRQGAEHLPTQFGIAFVDTSTAEFNLATFYDDMDRTKFETLITQIKPKEIVVEKGGLSMRSIRILKNSLGPNTIWNHLRPVSEFFDEVTALDEIRIREYFGPNTPGTVATECWPSALQKMCDCAPVMSALGGLIWYLRSLKLDEELLSFKNFHIYDPVRQASTLILDGQTLSNLEVFQNNSDGTEAGTVFRLLNRCVTPFGKRLFRRWLCHPLRSSSAISARLDAVEDLMRVPGFLELFEEKCVRFPDLERIVSRIHAGSCKVSEFLVVLSTFRTIIDTTRRLSSYTEQFKSKKLESVLAEMPNLTPYLDYFNEAFDQNLAATEGDIVPYPGFATDYDSNNEDFKQLASEFAEHLEKAKRLLKTTKVIYKDLGKEIYQIEVSNKVAVPKNWKKMSGTNAVSRYYNPELIALVNRLQEAKETKSAIMKELQGRLYSKFDENFKDWLKAVKIMAEIDCLGSLSKSSSALGSPACRPEFVESEQSVLELEGMRHPCVIPGIASDFIPNDTVLGGNSANLILLTGPNMGGKSTLLRQTCIAIIMAQLGCYVPAEKCRLTPFDRIFTRIGANDNILAGQSTFMVELSETSKILAEATDQSMVILDELGRGTSTFDGYAIAYSVLHELSTRIGCLGLFSTHYGTLTTEFERDPNVALKHMACQVDQTNREVTFLYKLIDGVCEKSYGMNVAHMAGVPRKIVDRAEEMAEAFELKQETKWKEEKHLMRGTKNVGQGIIMDLAYLLSRVDYDHTKKNQKNATMGINEGGQGGAAAAADHDDGSVIPLRARARHLSKEQESKVLRRIFKSMACL
ncbi:DNA mismatch repair protein msh6 [Lobosporangium transversale]|uniref:DNA mismatch repair protein n=1 Tax=Lobosporangium transversale TaxID=64571 RepID=A0A1Y2GG18_9FUNG|nr:muts domain V-domain-containing protein [Lobosporangium transversale]KAF9917476.1 DNA mismatch repair protein msh6 [Lobosporangium transversale]ORZ09752.1 muts domain V-domain-containing protein [Lobosporangium transversale]|eukprot:XP_021879022.1 muts domain V-domain-containing protein [Lobosporangium transversale]